MRASGEHVARRPTFLPSYILPSSFLPSTWHAAPRAARTTDPRCAPPQARNQSFSDIGASVTDDEFNELFGPTE